MSRRLTLDEVNSRVTHRGYKVVGDYVCAGVHTVFECAEGHQWKALPDNVLRGKGCPHCAGVFKYTRESLNSKLEPRGIQLIGTYGNANTRSDFECVCGHKWVGYPGAIVSGVGCPKCAKYGFNPQEPAFFYSVGLNDSIIGFGITKDPDTRARCHARNVKDRGGRFSQLDLFLFETGSLAKDLEDEVLDTIPCSGSDVPSFYREAFHASHYWDMRKLVERYVHETVYSFQLR